MFDIKKIIKKGDYLYALVPDHPNATKNGYVLMHRVVVENYLNRLLSADEIVHHKDGNKHNNDISNLEVMSAVDHARYHGAQKHRDYVQVRCEYCGKVFLRERRLIRYKKIFCSKLCC